MHSICYSYLWWTFKKSATIGLLRFNPGWPNWAKFSLLGRLFSLRNSLKSTNVALTIWQLFSGHPGSIALKKKNVLYIQTKRIRRADRISADQDCQIKPKIPFLVNFWWSCNGRCWYILWPFGQFFRHLVYFVCIWYIFHVLVRM
jgi:hypothetical protein